MPDGPRPTEKELLDRLVDALEKADAKVTTHPLRRTRRQLRVYAEAMLDEMEGTT